MRKLGLLTTRAGDVELATAVLGALAENQVDFTLFFRRLADAQDKATAVRFSWGSIAAPFGQGW